MASGGDMEEVVVSMSKASIEVKVNEEGKKIDRHCAFCLTLVPGAEVKLCSKCKRRAYCSKECQKADWKATPNDPTSNGKICGYGQGHKNWCGLEVGEEDLDWKVAPISGKGLGLVALRDLPPLYRILIEGMQHPPNCEGYRHAGPPMAKGAKIHPGLSELHPPNADVATKFLQNGLMSAAGFMKVGLRLSRVNHSCKSNAAFTEDPNPKLAVFILCAEKEIKAGEEICRSYSHGLHFPYWFGPDKLDVSPKTVKQWGEELSKKWGVNCPASCFCQDEKAEKLLQEIRKLWSYCNKNPMKKSSLEKLLKLIENAKEFSLGPLNLLPFFLFASRLAMARSKTLDQAGNYMKTSLEILEAAYHPKSFEDIIQQGNPADLSNYPEYLAAEDVA